MSKENKTHFRKVYKSDHLGVADLEDLLEAKSNLIFTVSHVNQEYGVAVAGRKGNYNIAYFKEGIKPLVLNAGNSKIMKGHAGGSPFVEDWKNITIRLYIDYNVKMKGEIVGGVRISPEKVQNISEKQVSQLTDMLLAIGKSAEDYCSYLRVSSLENIPASQFSQCVAELQPVDGES